VEKERGQNDRDKKEIVYLEFDEQLWAVAVLQITPLSLSLSPPLTQLNKTILFISFFLLK